VRTKWIQLTLSTSIGALCASLLALLLPKSWAVGFFAVSTAALAVAAYASALRDRAARGTGADDADAAAPEIKPQEGLTGIPAESPAPQAREPGPEAQAILACLNGIAEALELIPFLRSIIHAVPGETEAAAFALMEKFELIKKMAGEAAKDATALDSASDGNTLEEKVNSIAASSRASLEAEKSAMAEIAELNRRNSKVLKQMSDEIGSGIELLAGIEEISQKSHLIALNLSVEAAHIGQQGLGFKVIATELRSLNSQTSEFSGRVSLLLNSLRDRSAGIIGQMAEKSESAVAKAETGMNHALATVESLIETSSACHKFSVKMADMTIKINREMDGVLEALQFQDITRQMLESAERISNEITPLIRDAGSRLSAQAGESGNRASSVEEIRMRLIGLAKTKGEKKAIMEVKA
jgi:methyl-accepting chemotaxis protein